MPPKEAPKEERPTMHTRSNTRAYADYGNAHQGLQGRLVLILEHSLTDASRNALRTLMKRFMATPDVTMISGLSRASMLQAQALESGFYYNQREYLPPEQAFTLMPWREIWVVADGMVWALNPHGTEA